MHQRYLVHIQPQEAAGVDLDQDYEYTSNDKDPMPIGNRPSHMGSLLSVEESHKDVGVLSTRELQRQIYNTKSRTELWELGNKEADRLDPNSLVSFVKWWA